MTIRAADVWEGSFRAWLRVQIGRDDRVGDIAREVAADGCMGQKRSPRSMLAHLMAEHDPVPEAMEAFSAALAEWQAII